jgi:small-conductance mechanosensitive channel
LLDEHPAMLKTPEPRIIFADFGDSALLFEAYFWQRARAILDRRTVESEVPYRIDDWTSPAKPSLPAGRSSRTARSSRSPHRIGRPR